MRARKITADLSDAPLRYHPALIYRESRNGFSRRLPALVAAVTDNSGEITGIHRTFLDPAHAAKANVASPRRSLGAILGNGVRFGAIDEFAILGEGIETVLSLKSAFPKIPMVAALSAAHLAAWEFRAGLRRLIIAADNDRAGRNAARRLAERAEAGSIDVITIASPKGDFNSDRRVMSEKAFQTWLGGLLVPHLIASEPGASSMSRNVRVPVALSAYFAVDVGNLRIGRFPRSSTGPGFQCDDRMTRPIVI